MRQGPAAQDEGCHVSRRPDRADGAAGRRQRAPGRVVRGWGSRS